MNKVTRIGWVAGVVLLPVTLVAQASPYRDPSAPSSPYRIPPAETGYTVPKTSPFALRGPGEGMGPSPIRVPDAKRIAKLEKFDTLALKYARTVVGAKEQLLKRGVEPTWEEVGRNRAVRRWEKKERAAAIRLRTFSPHKTLTSFVLSNEAAKRDPVRARVDAMALSLARMSSIEVERLQSQRVPNQDIPDRVVANPRIKAAIKKYDALRAKVGNPDLPVEIMIPRLIN